MPARPQYQGPPLDQPLVTQQRRRRRSRYEAVPTRWFRFRRLLTVAVLTAVALSGLWVVRTTVALTNFGHVSLSDLLGIVTGHSTSATAQQLQAHDRVNIALYGYGGDGHDGAYLSDSIMVVSIQQREGHAVQVAELSIPRDWWVPINLGGGRTHHARINEAFADGQAGAPDVSTDFTPPDNGGPMADATLERLLGIHIDHYVGIDFTAFQSMVDAVGGVDVSVPNTFTDHQYPRGECAPGGDCSTMTVHFDAGQQHMDGTTALEFARSRHADQAIEASDFARSRRQQLIVAAIKQRALSAGGIGRLPDLLSALSGHMVTDMNLNDETALYSLVKDVDAGSITHVSLDDTNFLAECGYPRNCDSAVLFAHDRSYTSIQRFVQRLLPDPAALAERAKVTVLDGSSDGGAASYRWSALLRSLGYDATDAGATSTTAVTTATDAGGAAHSAAWLAEYFNVSPSTLPSTLPAGAAAAQASVTLVLGQDEEQLFNNRSGDSLHD